MGGRAICLGREVGVARSLLASGEGGVLHYPRILTD